MKQLFFASALVLLCSTITTAQENKVTVRTVDKPLPRPLGSFIIFYTSRALEINAWEVYEVWDTKIIPESQLAENLRDKINHPIVARYEWKPGYRWADAARIARAKSAKFAFRNTYTRVDGAGNKLTVNDDGGTGYISVYTGDARRQQADGEVIDFSKEDYVAQLPPDIINKLKAQFVKEQTRLIQNGWVRYSSNYEYTPTKYLYFNKQLDWEYSYSAIAVALDTGALVKVNCSNTGLANFTADLPVSFYGCYYDMQSPKEGVTYEIKISSPAQNKVPIGLIVFRRKTNLEKEVEEIISNAYNSFNGLKGDLLSSKAGEEIFAGNLKLGMTRTKVVYDDKQGIWIYQLSGTAGTPDVKFQVEKLTKLLGEKEKAGVYRLEKSAVNGIEKTDVFDKEKRKLFTVANSNNREDEIGFYFYEQTISSK